MESPDNVRRAGSAASIPDLSTLLDPDEAMLFGFVQAVAQQTAYQLDGFPGEPRDLACWVAGTHAIMMLRAHTPEDWNACATLLSSNPALLAAVFQNVDLLPDSHPLTANVLHTMGEALEQVAPP